MKQKFKDNPELAERNREHLTNLTAKRMKPVRCIELNKEFPSAVEAGKFVGRSENGIHACCKGRGNTCGGYHWEYVNEEDRIEAQRKRQKYLNSLIKPNYQVHCVELNKTWEANRDAERELNLPLNSITQVINGRHETAGGYHWVKANENGEIVIPEELKKFIGKKPKKVTNKKHQVRRVETGEIITR